MAYRNEGGTVVVVLCHRPKLEMESQFAAIIPEEQRFGTRFCFRQVHPPAIKCMRPIFFRRALVRSSVSHTGALSMHQSPTGVAAL